MANKNDYREKINMAGGVPEQVVTNRELIRMLASHVLELEKRIKKLEGRSTQQES